MIEPGMADSAAEAILSGWLDTGPAFAAATSFMPAPTQRQHRNCMGKKRLYRFLHTSYTVSHSPSHHHAQIVMISSINTATMENQYVLCIPCTSTAVRQVGVVDNQ